MVVQSHVTHERLLQILTTGESMRFEHISNAPIEALNHAVGSGRAWLGQAVLNAQGLGAWDRAEKTWRNQSSLNSQG
jgi:hypothetical protein